jgi:hypothetical protein
LLVLIQAHAPASPVKRPSPLNVVSLAADQAPKTLAVAKPKITEIIVPQPRILVPAEVALPAADANPQVELAAAGGGLDCELGEGLRRAIQANPVLANSIEQIAPGSRSVANAIMLWEGAWVSMQDPVSQAAVTTLRQAITEGIEAAPPECLAAELTGPRFVILSDGIKSTTLVIGSGAWRWSQLLAEDGPSPQEAQSL